MDKKIYVKDCGDEKLNRIWEKSPLQEGISRPITSGNFYQSDMSGVLETELVKIIAAAVDTVFLCSFLLAHKKIVETLKNAAVERGVQVFILTSSDVRLKNDINNGATEFDQKTFKEHVELLNSLSGIVQVRSADCFHAKFILVDARKNPAGFLTTCNITEKALTENPELGYRLSRTEVRELAQLFTYAFWEKSQMELRGTSMIPIKPSNWNSLPLFRERVAATCDERRDILKQVSEIIKQTEKNLIVSSYLISEKEVVKALCDKAKEGVRVVYMTRENKDKQLNFLEELVKEGVEVIGVPLIHAKAIVSDGKRGIVMSANFEARGLHEGFETGIVLGESECASLLPILESWPKDECWLLRHSILKKELRIDTILKGREKIMVKDTHSIDCKVLEADCLTKIDKKPEFNKYRTPADVLAKKIQYEWTVKLPVISKKAKEVEYKIEYTVESMILKSVNQIPQEGKNKIITVKINDDIYIAVFDNTGERVKNKKKNNYLFDKDDLEAEPNKAKSFQKELYALFETKNKQKQKYKSAVKNHIISSLGLSEKKSPPYRVYNENGNKVFVIKNIKELQKAKSLMNKWDVKKVVLE